MGIHVTTESGAIIIRDVLIGDNVDIVPNVVIAKSMPRSVFVTGITIKVF